ncbi:MAG: DoxX family protein [Candidatus Yonathbacteria bacterium]|nr:DoxX family protein [Candidatus Yonathbacteria bacterium]
MQTVSLFPFLLDFQMLGVFMLRVTLGLIFVYFCYEKVFLFRKDQILFYEKLGLRPAKVFSLIVASLEGLTGALLAVGLYTQGVAIVAGVLMALATIIKWRSPSALPKNTNDFYVILTVVSFSLLFLGAGAFAIDLPL